MPYARDIRALDAKVLAMEMVFTHVFNRVGRLDQILTDAIRQGFDDAANNIQELAIKSGDTVSSDSTVNALAVIERLRAITLANLDRMENGI